MSGIRLVTRRIDSTTPPLSTTQIQILLHNLVPHLSDWKKDYEEAAGYLAGVNPILAMKVRVAMMRATLILPDGWQSTAASLPGLSEVASDLLDPAALDEAIYWLAEMHGKKARKEVSEELRKQDDPDPKFEQLIEQLIPFAGKPNS